MSNEIECEEYPDIHDKTEHPDKKTREEVAKKNAANAKLYRALRHILRKDFDFPRELPHYASDFPGSLDDAHRAQYLAIHGILLADNWTDPSLGKDRASGDDVIVKGRPGEDDLVVARRFVDATVKAVQEFTSRAELFKKVFGFLKAEGKPRTDGVGRHNVQTTTSV